MKIYADPKDNPNQNTVKSENPNAFSDNPNKKTEKEKLKDLHGAQKLQYIWDYYKTPIIIGILVLLVIFYTVYDRMHAQKTVVSLTCTNVSMDEDLVQKLSHDFLTEYVNLNPSKYDVMIDTNLSIGDEANTLDPQYAYTSQMKLMAYIASGQMDLILMNQNAFDYLAANGFLQNLTEVFAEADEELNDALKGSLVSNDVIIEDNSREVSMNPETEYKAVIETLPLGLKVTGTTLFPEGYYNQDLFIGIAANTTKTDASMQYLRYLFGLEPGDFDIVPEK